jgi:hypothetical protein
MSKTDKTTPWFVVERRGDCPRECRTGGYPCKHFSSSGTLGVLKQKKERSMRTKLRVDFANGVEPEPARHRRNALWDVA